MENFYFFFDQPVKNDLKPYDSTPNIATGQGHVHNWFFRLMFFIIEKSKETVLNFSNGTGKVL